MIRQDDGKEYPKFDTVIVPIKSVVGFSTYRKFFLIPKIVAQLGGDIVLEPTNFGPFNLKRYVKRVTVIHDITPIIYPQWHTFNGWFWQKLLLRRIANKADKILTVSDNTKSDIIDQFGLSEKAIDSIHLGVSNKFRFKPLPSILNRFRINSNFFLTVGTIEPRKNHIGILQAYEQFRNNSDSNSELIIVGGDGWKNEIIHQKINSHPYKKDIFILGYISDYEIIALYSLCRAFIYASHYEGFGLPVIEASACGAQCLVAYNSSLRELSNSFISYFNSIDELSQLMIKSKKLDDEREIEQNSTEVKKKFSWESYVDRFLSSITSLTAINPHPNLYSSTIPIIIINWNGYQDTLECIDSVLKLAHTNYEIHLIDNNSDKGEGLKLKSLYENNDLIQVHLYESNLGFTGAHNRIYNEWIKLNPKYEFIALLNNDTVVDEYWLTQCENRMRHSGLNMISSKMINYFDHSTMDNAGHTVLRNGEILPIGSGQSIHQYKEPFENMGPSAGAALYDLKMIKTIGFFDPHFDTGFEDAEFGLRSILAGYKSEYCPSAIVYHKGGQSIAKIFNEEYAINNLKNIYYTSFKLFPKTILILLFPVILLRTSTIIIASYLFGKKKINRITRQSFKEFFKRDINVALAKRKSVQSIRKISSIRIFLLMRSFILIDLKRALNYLIKGERSALDQYH